MRCDACVLFVSSLQSLNEVLASGSKEENKAAVEKQVEELFLCSASGLKPETIGSQHVDKHIAAVSSGAGGECSAAEGEGG